MNLRDFTDEGKKEKEIEYKKEYDQAINNISNDKYLWDMRCWDNYKDIEEMERWLDNDCNPNNCGNVRYSINLLKREGVSNKEIISLMLKNPHKEYNNRLAVCFKDPNKCSRFKEVRNYSESDCWKCMNKPIKPNTIKIKTIGLERYNK
tara:strand:+ start:348 stop:794 length:447 start_codon:yes stop_codon:yes gene_type:complete